MRELLIAIGLQALYQRCCEWAIATGRILSRRDFMSMRFAVMHDPVTLIELCRVKDLGLPPAPQVTGSKILPSSSLPPSLPSNGIKGPAFPGRRR